MAFRWRRVVRGGERRAPSFAPYSFIGLGKQSLLILVASALTLFLTTGAKEVLVISYDTFSFIF